ncbi:hypothetical protein [Streptomyces sp. NBC_01508]|uniref:hypothetical protein n=1 Tax=Streptomyces sp. NBC_01508 TaxID=2903888 RepID=UPI00386FE769
MVDGRACGRTDDQEGTPMIDGRALYALNIESAEFVKACGGPCTEGCVTLSKIGPDAAGISPERFGL